MFISFFPDKAIITGVGACQCLPLHNMCMKICFYLIVQEATSIKSDGTKELSSTDPSLSSNGVDPKSDLGRGIHDFVKNLPLSISKTCRVRTYNHLQLSKEQRREPVSLSLK